MERSEMRQVGAMSKPTPTRIASLSDLPTKGEVKCC